MLSRIARENLWRLARSDPKEGSLSISARWFTSTVSSLPLLQRASLLDMVNNDVRVGSARLHKRWPGYRLFKGRMWGPTQCQAGRSCRAGVFMAQRHET